MLKILSSSLNFLFRMEIVVEPWIENLFPALRKQLHMNEETQSDDIIVNLTQNTINCLPAEKLSEVNIIKSANLKLNENELNPKKTLDVSSLYRSFGSLSTAGNYR